MKRIFNLLLGTVLVVILAACSKPLPEDKLSYAGDWQSKSMRLMILRDGTVAYERLKSGGNVSVNGPVKKFEGNDFEVGLGPFSTRFVVTRPPYKDNQQWKMVVDGVELVKVGEAE